MRYTLIRFISLAGMLILLLSGILVTAQQSERDLSADVDALAAAGIERLTDRWLIQTETSIDPQTLSAQTGYEVIGATGSPNTYEIRLSDTVDTSSVQALQALRTRRAELLQQPGIVRAEPVVILIRESRSSIPTDPLYTSQWHLNNTGQSGGTSGEDINIGGAWVRPNWPSGGYTGNGVQIGVLDDGVEYVHPDLDNYDSSRSYDYYDGDQNAAPNSGNAHGTSAAGVAAADDDSTCGVGSAYDATLSSQRLIAGGFSSTQENNALGNSLATTTELDVSSNSWGPSDNATVLGAPGSITLNTMQSRVTNGRNGLGWIYVWANGNGHSSTFQNADWAGADAYTSSRYTVAVSATDHNGNQSSYSEGGTNIIVNAPSSGAGVGITTTDRLGSSEGYGGLPDPDCTNGYSGTSSAAPLVSGVIALMLEANPNLTWRDVQYVLLNTAQINDPTDASWITNGAGYLNSEYYGFGRVDAERAVTTAAFWNNVSSDVSQSSGVQTVNITPADGGAPSTTTYTVNSSSITSLEHVEITVNATSNYRGDMELVLTSPSGTDSMLMKRRWNDLSSNGWNNWTFTTSRFWGENPQGTWTLSIRDAFTGGTLTFNDYNMTLHGTSTTPEYVDVELTTSDSPDPVQAGAIYQHTVTMTNVGSTTTDLVLLEVQLPTGFSLATTPSNCSNFPSSIVCTFLSSKAPGQSHMITLDVAVAASVTAGTYSVRNTSTVSNPQNDLNTLNNVHILETIEVQAFTGSTDVNNDGITSPTDAVYVINRLGTSDAAADVDNNGTVDSNDLQAVLNNLGN